MSLNCHDDFFEFGKVSIVQAKPPGELLDPFDRIQLGAVRWQEVQREARGLLLAPKLMQMGMMVSGVVDDDHNAVAASHTDAPQITKKVKEGGTIELLPFLAKHEPAVTQSHSAKVPHALACGGVQQDGIFDFR